MDTTASKHNPILEGLNPEQYRAVVTPGSLLVLAGAGSGKTRVLSSRIANFIKSGVGEQNILAVTFTNKAAREMKGRINSMLGSEAKDLWVGTFHGICNQILREFGRKIGVDPNFHILDTTDQQSLVKRLLKDMGITKDDLKMNNESLGSVVSKINKIKEGGGLKPGAKGYVDEIYVKYMNTCEKEGAFDFADLLIKTNQVLSGNVGGIRDHYQARFSKILVDEFQDTNPEQSKWLALMRAPSAELFAVGDDDQSIYAFRGSDPKYMSSFLKDLAAGNIIRLEQNYRSTGNILAAANAVISNNTDRIGKTLRTDVGSGSKVDVLEFDRDNQEANYIATTIKELLRDGVAHHEIAVLYRSNFQSALLEREMLKANVPYIIHGGTRFFERQEVKDVMAYARLALKKEDNGAFYRVANQPPRGLGEKSLGVIYESAIEHEVSYMDMARLDEGGKIQVFVDIIDELDMSMDMLSLPEFFEYIMHRTGLEALYQKDEEAESRLKNMAEVVSLATRFIEEALVKPTNAREAMAEFMSTFTLEDATQDTHQSKKKAVTMMTIHAAKGLEFEHVFLNGTEENSLPHSNALEEDGGLEEERRLMYVAITRAKQKMTVSSSKRRYIYGDPEPRERSRFIDELPEFACNFREFSSPPPPAGAYKKPRF